MPSVKAAWYADVRRAGAIGRTRLLARAQRRLGPGGLDPPRAAGHAATREQVFAVVDAAFAQRRKALRGVLRALAPAERVDAALEQAGVSPLARGETLSVEDYVRLAEALDPQPAPHDPQEAAG